MKKKLIILIFAIQIMGGMYDRRVVVSGRRLIAHSDLINQLFTTELNPTGREVATGERIPYLINQQIHVNDFPL